MASWARSACVLALLAPAAADPHGGPVAMHRIALGECGEALLDGRLAELAAGRLWKFEKGSCAEQGYTLPAEATTLELPGVAAIQSQMSLACGGDLDKHAEAAQKLARLAGFEGAVEEFRKLCAERAPGASEIVLTRFKKPDLLNLAKSLASSDAPRLPPGLLGGQRASREAGPAQACCKECAAPREKYYSVDMAHGHCGECCMEPSMFRVFKLFEPNLTKADGKTCGGLGFPDYATTVTHGVFPLSMTLDEYNAVSEALPEDMQSGYKVADGLCGEVAIDKKWFDYVSQVAQLTKGFCKDVQHNEPDGTRNITVPVLGQIIVHLYKKAGELDLLAALRFAKAVVLDEKTTLYRAAGGQCAQAMVEPQFEQAIGVPLGLLGFAQGSCSEHGYTEAAGSQTTELPVAGKIELALFREAEAQVLV